MADFYQTWIDICTNSKNIPILAAANHYYIYFGLTSTKLFALYIIDGMVVDYAATDVASGQTDPLHIRLLPIGVQCTWGSSPSCVIRPITGNRPKISSALARCILLEAGTPLGGTTSGAPRMLLLDRVLSAPTALRQASIACGVDVFACDRHVLRQRFKFWRLHDHRGVGRLHHWKSIPAASNVCQTVFRSILFGQISGVGNDSQMGIAGIMMSCMGICELPVNTESSKMTEMGALILQDTHMIEFGATRLCLRTDIRNLLVAPRSIQECAHIFVTRMHQNILTARTVVVYAMIRQFLNVPAVRVVLTEDIRSPEFVFHQNCGYVVADGDTMDAVAAAVLLRASAVPILVIVGGGDYCLVDLFIMLNPDMFSVVMWSAICPTPQLMSPRSPESIGWQPRAVVVPAGVRDAVAAEFARIYDLMALMKRAIDARSGVMPVRHGRMSCEITPAHTQDEEAVLSLKRISPDQQPHQTTRDPRAKRSRKAVPEPVPMDERCPEACDEMKSHTTTTGGVPVTLARRHSHNPVIILRRAPGVPRWSATPRLTDMPAHVPIENPRLAMIRADYC